LEDFNQAIRLAPNYSSAYEQRGLIKKEQSKKTEAMKDLQKAIELYRQDNKTDKVNELEIVIANLNLDL
jgi:tetratricopeptide (TPR) repeat protein